MSKNEQEKEFSENINLFDFNEDKEDEQNDLDLEGFDGYEKEPEPVLGPDIKSSEEEEDKLNFEEEEEKDKSLDDKDFDLDSFNKKLGTAYKTKEELKEALNLKEEESESEKEEKELSQIEDTLSIYEPIMKLGNEDLMRKQYESVALQNKQDLNDEDVKIEIEEKIQNLIDNGTLDLYAKDLRNEINNAVINPALSKKGVIEANKTQRINAQKKTETENLQNAFADFYHTGNFYGIKPDKDKITEVYKKANNGDFINQISSDPKLRAELALFVEFKEEIFKKSAGLDYGDGMKAVLDEYKNKKDSIDVSRIQSKGGSAGTNKSDGLLADILKESPAGEEIRMKV